VAYTEPADRERARQLVGADRFVDVDPQTLSSKDEEAIEEIARMLEIRGFVRADERGIAGDGI
jgi:hypothetical protein